MNQQARVTSIESIHHFRIELRRYEERVRDTLEQLLRESRRALEWVEGDRVSYWPNEMRKAENGLASARSALERAKLSKLSNETKDCYDEQKLLEQNQTRLRLSEEKIKIVRRWRHLMRQHADDLEAKLARLTRYLESDLPKAMAALDRMTRALEKYAQVRKTTEGSAPNRQDYEQG